MAGKVLFEQGRHVSRTGFRGEITEADMRALRAAAPPYVLDDALADFAAKIMFAKADAKRGYAYVSSRDQLAQLKRLRRLATQEMRNRNGIITDMDGVEHSFIELTYALFNLDQATLERIKAADLAAIQEIVDRDGVFVDVDGVEHHLVPPTIQIVMPSRREIMVFSEHQACGSDKPTSRSPGSVWFPRGVEGFADSVVSAIVELESQQDDAGRREKSWHEALAQMVVEFWGTHCPNERQAANRNSKTGLASPIVSFARVVFQVADFGTILSASRLANLLLHAQKKS